jgi:hypothetical protein
MSVLGALVLAVPAQARSPYCGITWGSTAKVQSDATGPGDHVDGVRAGRHTCYDRLVFDLNGPSAVGYAARYVPVVHADAGGAPVRVRGGAALEVVVRGPIQGMDSQGHQPLVTAPKIGQDLVPAATLAGFASLRQVAFAGSFEGQSTVAVGVRERLPFHVAVIGDGHYRHVILDVAH